MGNFSSLRDAIAEVIRQNGNEEITGEVLQFILLEMVDGLGEGYRYVGMATPLTEPREMEGPAFYLAGMGGIYQNFGVDVPQGISVIKWDGTQWSVQTLWTVDSEPMEGSTALVKSGGVYQKLQQKVEKEAGKGLSEADFTNNEKLKLQNLPTAHGLTELLEGKQDRLEFDNAPEEGSLNPVTSGGIKESIRYFITKAVNDLVYYYKKTEVYTKDEVDAIVSGVSHLEIIAVDVLPEPSAATIGKIFLVPAEVGESMDEYITLRSTEGGDVTYYWQKIGSSDIDLSNYPTTDDMNTAIATALADYYTKTEVDELIAAAKGTVADLSLDADKDIILVDTATVVTVIGRTQVVAESLVISRGGVEKAAGVGRLITASETLQVDEDVTYLLTAVIGGVERTKELTVEVVGAVYYGAGTEASEIVTKATPRKSPEGIYEMGASEGDRLFVLVPDGMTVNGMSMNGIDIPLETPTGVMVDGMAYLSYKSSNEYQAGTYKVVVY